jgi:hypothetical protein
MIANRVVMDDDRVRDPVREVLDRVTEAVCANEWRA